MRARFNKNKGTTLIEVLISITIFSIISIPLSMMVISAIGNNKKGENKQDAVVVAQQIVEQLKANNTTPDIVTVTTDTTHKLTFNTTGSALLYSVKDADVGNGLTATVTFEKKLSYGSASTTSTEVVYDLSIEMYSDQIIITGTNATTGITGRATYPITHDLKICDNNNNTIQFQDNFTGSILGAGTCIYNITKSNIKISYFPNYTSHEIHFRNNATTPLSVYIFNQDNQNGDTYTNDNGSIEFYDNLSSTSTGTDSTTNGIYDISVDIYKGKSSNNINIYNTKTSISLGT